MDEFLHSLQKGMKERLSSAFLFNFILLWIIYNWEFVYITVFVNEATLAPDNRFDRLRDTQFKYWLPILFAFLLSIITPLINSIIQLIKHLIRKLRDILETKIDGRVAYTDKQFAQLKTRYDKLEAQYNKAITESEMDKSTIVFLQESKNEFEKKYNDQIEIYKNETDKLKSDNLELKETLGKFLFPDNILDKEDEYLDVFKFKDENKKLLYFNFLRTIKKGENPINLMSDLKNYTSEGNTILNLEDKFFLLKNHKFKFDSYYMDKSILRFSASDITNILTHFTIERISKNLWLVKSINIKKISMSYILGIIEPIN